MWFFVLNMKIMHVYICCVQSTYVHFKYENVHQWPFKIILSWNMSKSQTFFQCGTLFLKNCLFLEDACVSWNNDDILHSQMRKKALQLHTICSSVPCYVTQSPCIWCSDSIRFPGSFANKQDKGTCTCGTEIQLEYHYSKIAGVCCCQLYS